MKKVRFFGQGKEASGYGNAIRNFAKAFDLSGVPTIFMTKGLGVKDKYFGSANVDFYIHGPPYSLHKSSNHKIGYFYWETNKLHPRWAREIHYLDEIWVPCELVKDAVINAAYKKPIKIVPTPMKKFDRNIITSIPSPGDVISEKKVFKFYSIFQWHKRKGYEILLKAYLSEFSKDDDVVLILKVNALNIKNLTKESIRKDILKIKSYLGKKDFPLIYVSDKIVDENHIYGLHNISDCYVAPHYGEGWGMPIHDAMYAEKNIITTKFGGVTDFLDENSAHIISHDLVPVSGMDWSGWYQKDQYWAEPSVTSLKNIMRDVYINHEKYYEKRSNARKIAESMSIENISEIIKGEFK